MGLRISIENRIGMVQQGAGVNIAPYINRVIFEGGTVTYNSSLKKVMDRNAIDKPVLAYSCFGGHTFRQSGVNQMVAKGFSTSGVNDLVQTTALNQPYSKPSDLPGLNYLANPNNGSSYMTHSPISFAANEPWTVEVMLNYNGSNKGSDGIVGLISDNIDGGNFISLSKNGGELQIANQFGYTPNAIPNIIGKNKLITITGNNGIYSIYVNGILIANRINNTAFNFISIFNGYYASSPNLQFNGKIYSYHIFNKALNQSEVTNRYSLLRSIFPEIETCKIGTQDWTVRNYEAVATPQGNLIPEVQDSTAWSNSQATYDSVYASTSGTVDQKTYAAVKAAAGWSHYNNDPIFGAMYGKLYNWFAVKLLQMDIDYYNAANPTALWGYKAPSEADWNTLIATLGGASIAGGKLKMTGLNYWNTSNIGADNNSGFTALAGGVRLINGLFDFYKVLIGFATSNEFNYNLQSDLNTVANYPIDKIIGYSLRLIKD